MDQKLALGLRVAKDWKGYIECGDFSNFVTIWKNAQGTPSRARLDGFLEVMAAAHIEPFTTIVTDTNKVSDDVELRVRGLMSSDGINLIYTPAKTVQNPQWLQALKHLGLDVYCSEAIIVIGIPEKYSLPNFLQDLYIFEDIDLQVSDFHKL